MMFGPLKRSIQNNGISVNIEYFIVDPDAFLVVVVRAGVGFALYVTLAFSLCSTFFVEESLAGEAEAGAKVEGCRFVRVGVCRVVVIRL